MPKTSRTETYEVALVEDDRDTRDLIERTIGKCRTLKLVAAYPAAPDALRHLPNARPDVVLMDIKMPGMSGIDCVRALRGLTPAFKAAIVMLTEYAEDNLIFDALKAGANGYLLKQHASATELEAAIQEVLEGGAPFSPSVAKKIVEYFHTADAGRAEPQPTRGPQSRLTARETQVLELLEQGRMYKEIGPALSVSLNTVRTHIRSIYHKLHLHSRTDAMMRLLRK